MRPCPDGPGIPRSIDRSTGSMNNMSMRAIAAMASAFAIPCADSSMAISESTLAGCRQSGSSGANARPRCGSWGKSARAGRPNTRSG